MSASAMRPAGIPSQSWSADSADSVAKALRRRDYLTVIDRTNHDLIQPLLYQLATRISPREHARELRAGFRTHSRLLRRETTFRRATPLAHVLDEDAPAGDHRAAGIRPTRARRTRT